MGEVLLLIITHVLQMRKLRHRTVKRLVEEYTADKWQSGNQARLSSCSLPLASPISPPRGA